MDISQLGRAGDPGAASLHDAIVSLDQRVTTRQPSGHVRKDVPSPTGYLSFRERTGHPALAVKGPTARHVWGPS